MNADLSNLEEAKAETRKQEKNFKQLQEDMMRISMHNKPVN